MNLRYSFDPDADRLIRMLVETLRDVRTDSEATLPVPLRNRIFADLQEAAAELRPADGWERCSSCGGVPCRTNANALHVESEAA